MPAANISVYYDNQADVDGQFNTVVYAGAVPPNQVGPPVSARCLYAPSNNRATIFAECIAAASQYADRDGGSGDLMGGLYRCLMPGPQ